MKLILVMICICATQNIVLELVLICELLLVILPQIQKLKVFRNFYSNLKSVVTQRFGNFKK